MDLWPEFPVGGAALAPALARTPAWRNRRALGEVLQRSVEGCAILRATPCFQTLRLIFTQLCKGSILARDSFRRAASFQRSCCAQGPSGAHCQFQRCDRRFRKTYNTRKTPAVSPLTTRAL